LVTELQVARAVAEGTLPSPTQWRNSIYVCLRLSGSGCAWRRSRGEFVWRSEEVWLSPAMQRRVLGLPIVCEHPSTCLLTSTSFAATVVGVIVYSYVNAEERALWGIGRILDASAADGIARGLFDTSPAVELPPGSGAAIDIDGKPLLVEAEPDYIDHLALVYVGGGNKGVWTREDLPGVQVDAPVAQE
jgi:hypothetical protein